MEHGSAFAGAIKQAVEAVINKSFLIYNGSLLENPIWIFKKVSLATP